MMQCLITLFWRLIPIGGGSHHHNYSQGPADCLKLHIGKDLFMHSEHKKKKKLRRNCWCQKCTWRWFNAELCEAVAHSPLFGSEKHYFRVNNVPEHACIISLTVLQFFSSGFLPKALDLFDYAEHILHFSHGFEPPTNHVWHFICAVKMPQHTANGLLPLIGILFSFYMQDNPIQL